MNRAERAQIISDILDNQYKKIPVPLDHSDPFTLLIAVLLSAQCTDERVNKITPKLFKKANNPKKMRKLTENFYGRLYSYSIQFDKIFEKKDCQLIKKLKSNFNEEKINYVKYSRYLQKSIGNIVFQRHAGIVLS